MRTLAYLATIAIAAVLMSSPVPSQVQRYTPQDGDAVVVYINKFRAEDFDRAKQVMVTGFSKAMTASGQTRHTYWIANPQTREILGISFFQPGHSVDQWHDNDSRQEVLKQLQELRSGPPSKREYELIGSHNTGD